MKAQPSVLFFLLALLFSTAQSTAMMRLAQVSSRTAGQLASCVTMPQAGTLAGLRLAATTRSFNNINRDPYRPISIQELNAHLEQARIRYQAEHAQERKKLLDEMTQLKKNINTYISGSIPFLVYAGYAIGKELEFIEDKKTKK